ncbi:hypothetical protein EYB53_023120 [Candidatus Chloroploca sp. M-50]|uniref:Uncharacterized protein n=1 Tax=Candidatus Chloroploca mongolica TaxID=2528176 RepID=A0ABS4DGQ3_9CHLR|nr:hypothetical protein [Candidatus Chloroploca mongolica]MBP1468624.1 hypothetical protein [Candidatus Chloroploca mongolica]
MMPVIRIPDPLYKRLQNLAVPFEDTPITVIERLVEEYESRQDKKSSLSSANDVEPQNFNPVEPPDLRHTRVIYASFNGEILRSPNWNGILDAAHITAYKQGLSPEALVRLTLSNAEKGEKTDNGFHFLPEISMSIQGVDANLAWRNTLHLAKHIKVPVEVHFEWRDKEGAAYPGEIGKFAWYPK